MKNFAFIFAIVGVIAAVTFGVGWLAGRSPGVGTVLMAVVALLGCLWIALFGYYGYGVSVGPERWIALALGFLPLIGLMVGVLLGLQPA